MSFGAVAHPLQEAEPGGACHAQQVVPEDKGCEVGVSKCVIACLQDCRDTFAAEGKEEDGTGQEKRKEVYQSLPTYFLKLIGAAQAIGAAHHRKGDGYYRIEEDPIGCLPKYQRVAEGCHTPFSEGGGKPECNHLCNDDNDRTGNHLDPGFHQRLEDCSPRIERDLHAVAISAYYQVRIRSLQQASDQGGVCHAHRTKIGMQELHTEDDREGKQQGGCMGVEEALMAVQQPVEDRSYADG